MATRALRRNGPAAGRATADGNSCAAGSSAHAAGTRSSPSHPPWSPRRRVPIAGSADFASPVAGGSPPRKRTDPRPAVRRASPAAATATELIIGIYVDTPGQPDCHAWLQSEERAQLCICLCVMPRVARTPTLRVTLKPQPLKGPSVGHILLWIMLISAALGTSCTALASSGTGRLWHVDTVELRRQQRFKRVLASHVDAVRSPRPAAAAPVQPMEEPVSVSPRLSAEPLRVAHTPCWPTYTPDR